ncbi:hypothetical protein BHE74_00029067 [Ensete ventricosum]|nr:hypothetical protein GW17_00052872 [Ensete ventricosum]RWW63738.1 hypothetical protein BHE74_00029067 [Ensete ventricosum]
MSRIQRGRLIIFQKDALASSLTFTAPPPSPLHRRRLPLPTDSGPAKGRLPLLAVGLAVGGSPLRVPYSQSPLRAPCSGLAIVGCPYSRLGHGWPPMQGAWPWPATPARGLVVACHPCRWLRWLPLFAAFVVKL